MIRGIRKYHRKPEDIEINIRFCMTTASFIFWTGKVVNDKGTWTQTYFGREYDQKYNHIV